LGPFLQIMTMSLTGSSTKSKTLSKRWQLETSWMSSLQHTMPVAVEANPSPVGLRIGFHTSYQADTWPAKGHSVDHRKGTVNAPYSGASRGGRLFMASRPCPTSHHISHVCLLHFHQSDGGIWPAKWFSCTVPSQPSRGRRFDSGSSPHQ